MYQLKALDSFFNTTLDDQKLDVRLIGLSHKDTKEDQILVKLKNSLKILSEP